MVYTRSIWCTLGLYFKDNSLNIALALGCMNSMLAHALNWAWVFSSSFIFYGAYREC